jgi:hypothetical protein
LDTTALLAIISSVIFQEVDYFEKYALSPSSLSDSYINSRLGKLTVLTANHFVSKVSTAAVYRRLVTG